MEARSLWGLMGMVYLRGLIIKAVSRLRWSKAL